MDYKNQLDELLTLAVEEEASDLHLSAGYPPILRVSGRLISLAKRKKLDGAEAQNLAFSLMSEEQRQKFLEKKELDFSFAFGKSRFRVNIFKQRDGISCALRRIPSLIPTIDDLNLPPIIHEFALPSQGFILVTGPAGQGKSTTLAAIIDEINHTRAEHIITIEDPVEYVFEGDRSVIEQREIHSDTENFPIALRSTFRQDPDIIMVGEMRDSETISTAITAAETGHLVFATLHTNSADQTAHRIIDAFPGSQQNQIRTQLAGSLFGIVSQRLLPRIKGGLIPVCEILISTPAVSSLIRENKIHELPLVIETSGEKGMISLNRALAKLVKENEISMETALSHSLNPTGLKILAK